MPQHKVQLLATIFWDIAPGLITPSKIVPFEKSSYKPAEPFVQQLETALASFVPYAQQANLDTQDPNVFLSRAAEDVRVFLISSVGEPWGFPLCSCAPGAAMQLNSYLSLQTYDKRRSFYDHRVQNMNWSHSYTCPCCEHSTGFPTFQNSAHIHMQVAQRALERQTA
jgi:hypothetical protein